MRLERSVFEWNLKKNPSLEGAATLPSSDNHFDMKGMEILGDGMTCRAPIEDKQSHTLTDAGRADFQQ